MIDFKTIIKHKIDKSSYLEIELSSRSEILQVTKEKDTGKALEDFVIKSIKGWGGITLNGKKLKYTNEVLKKLPLPAMKRLFEYVINANTAIGKVNKKKLKS
ncbi:MAG: hypothetical protein GY714_20935 [Desulfobacterales bacterium]|nr:hypothetical protein [Desulfobacterales bacterium]